MSEEAKTKQGNDKAKMTISLPISTMKLLKHVAVEKDQDACDVVNALILGAYSGHTFIPMVSSAAS